MKKILKYLMLMLVATLSLTLTACGCDEDEPEKPSQPTSDIISGNVSEYTRTYLFPDKHGNNGPCFYWEGNSLHLTNGNGYFSYEKMASVGSISKLNDIKSAPSSGWATNLPLEDNNGYIITYTKGGIAYYIRMLINLNKSVTGETVGIHYQYQLFTPSNI